MSKRKLLLCGIDLSIATVIYAVVVLMERYGIIVSPVMYSGLDVKTVIINLIIFYTLLVVFRTALGIYSYIWRYAWVGTYLRLLVSDFLSALVFLSVGALFPRLNLGFGPSAMMLAVNCLAALGARFTYQYTYAHHDSKKYSSDKDNHKINIAIVGAGNIGATLAQELLRNPQSHYKPICFIDLDLAKTGQSLNGLPVYPENNKIVEKIKTLPVHEIVIALPDIDGNSKEKLFNLYRKTGCKVKLYDYPLEDNMRTGPLSLRELHIEDLLFRDSIKFDNTRSREFYQGKTVLVTGGGGSIGSELCRQIARFSPKKLVIFDIYENNAYDIQQELIRAYGEKIDFEVLIGSVRDTKRLDEVFCMVKPDIVLHAAAHKHVPLMENSAVEAIKNNVFGTYNAANAAEKYNVDKFVLISTDKAVNPTNIMGATKRLCEMVIQCRSDSKTKFVAVRFGNVLGSNGSVIPLFKKQIESGGPITITDKRIIRYFMTIPEAAQLVLETGAMANKGELYVLDMGKPVRIYDLALNMIKLAGLTLHKDIEIVEVGLRPGEKLYEELLMSSEELDKTDNSLIYIERDTPCTRAEVEAKLDELRKALSVSTNIAVKDAIRRVVPTFRDPETLNQEANRVIEKQRSDNGDEYTKELLAIKS